MKIFVLAQNKKEAQELFNAGCGYITKAEAMNARSSPEIDNYYRNLLKVFEFKYENTTQTQQTSTKKRSITRRR